MATLIVNHRVKDYATWKPLYDQDSARRAGAGMREIAVGEKAGDPGNVYLVWHVEDPAGIQAMMQDPELKARMAEGGVISEPEVIMIM